MLDYIWHLVSGSFFNAFTKDSGISGRHVAVAVFPEGGGEGHQVWVVVDINGTKRAFPHNGEKACALAVSVRGQFKPKDDTLIIIGTRKLSRGLLYRTLRTGKAIKFVVAEETADKKSRGSRRGNIGLDMPFPFGKYGPVSPKHPNGPGLTTKEIIARDPSYFTFLLRPDIMGPDLLDQEAHAYLKQTISQTNDRHYAR